MGDESVGQEELLRESEIQGVKAWGRSRRVSRPAG